MSHTCTTIGLSPEAYQELKSKLHPDHILNDGMYLDLTGIIAWEAVPEE